MSLNKIKFGPNPFTFTKMYNGKYNNIEFILEYSKTSKKINIEDEISEDDDEFNINIIWVEDIHPDKKQIVEEGIKKLFKRKLEQDITYYNF